MAKTSQDMGVVVLNSQYTSISKFWHSLANDRTRRFLLAVGSGFLQKSIGLFTVVLQYPLILGILGVEQFGVYVLVTSGLSWASIVMNGFMPNLAREVSLAAARCDYEQELALFYATIRVAILVGFSLFIISIIVTLIGESSGYFTNDAIKPMVIASIMFWMYFSCIVFDSFLTGYQSQHIVNISTTAASALSTIILFLQGYNALSLSICIIIVYLPLILSKMLNILILFRIRPYLFRCQPKNIGSVTAKLFWTTIPFLMLLAALFIIQSFATVIVGFFLGARYSAEYSIAFRCIELACSLTIMINQGFMPALVDARAKGDFIWVVQARRWVFVCCLMFAGCFVILGTVWIKTIVFLWSGFVLNDLLFGQIVSIYLLVWVWRELNTTQLISEGLIWWAAAIMLLEAGVFVTLLVALLPVFGISGAGASLLLSGVLVSMWAMPLLRARSSVERFRRET